jgi:DNA topoisomerase-1
VCEVIPDVEGEGDQPKSSKKSAEKPKTASLFRSMQPETIDFDTALKLLSLPREVGVDPESGEMITSQNGRYGPYLKKGTDTRSLDAEELIFDIDLGGALQRFSEPKYGGRRQSQALKTLETDTVSGKQITIKNGRFGPYVTDGETNVTVPRGIDPVSIDQDMAVQMIAEKRAKGPAPKRAAKKPAAKKTPAKKTTTKTVKKTPAKKPSKSGLPSSKEEAE